MSARPRKKQYTDLPEHLLFDITSGKYIFTLVNGKKKTLSDVSKSEAISIAKEYNRIMRGKSNISVDSLIVESMNNSLEHFSCYVDRLVNRAIQEEQPAQSTINDWLNDAIRIKEFFSNIMPHEISLEHVNCFINRYHSNASANVQNRKVSFMKKLFSYAVDESIMVDNPATRKKMRRIARKERRRLSMEAFISIHNAAPLWLKTAMELSLQTTQARLEISRIKYSIKTPKNGVCGCVWFDVPKNGIYGTLYIHRQKTQYQEESHIAIPIGQALKKIIDDSRDNIASPFVVHRLPVKKSNGISKEVSHPTQVAPDYLSRAFSKLRDDLGLYADLNIEQRPTFHEIRALAAHVLNMQGYNPQARMAHSDEKSTKVYTRDHVEWVEVQHVEIKLG